MQYVNIAKEIINRTPAPAARDLYLELINESVCSLDMDRNVLRTDKMDAVWEISELIRRSNCHPRLLDDYEGTLEVEHPRLHSLYKKIHRKHYDDNVKEVARLTKELKDLKDSLIEKVVVEKLASTENEPQLSTAIMSFI